jgi:hypothetical protein
VEDCTHFGLGYEPLDKWRSVRRRTVMINQPMSTSLNFFNCDWVMYCVFTPHTHTPNYQSAVLLAVLQFIQENVHMLLTRLFQI